MTGWSLCVSPAYSGSYSFSPAMTWPYLLGREFPLRWLSGYHILASSWSSNLPYTPSLPHPGPELVSAPWCLRPQMITLSSVSCQSFIWPSTRSQFCTGHLLSIWVGISKHNCLFLEIITLKGILKIWTITKVSASAICSKEPLLPLQVFPFSSYLRVSWPSNSSLLPHGIIGALPSKPLPLPISAPSDLGPGSSRQLLPELQLLILVSVTHFSLGLLPLPLCISRHIPAPCWSVFRGLSATGLSHWTLRHVSLSSASLPQDSTPPLESPLHMPPCGTSLFDASLLADSTPLMESSTVHLHHWAPPLLCTNLQGHATPEMAHQSPMCHSQLSTCTHQLP